MKSRLMLAVLGAAAASEMGCSAIYDLDYTTEAPAPLTNMTPDAGMPGVDASMTAIDASTPTLGDGGPLCGDGGLGSACTNAVCVPFDNTARIVGYTAGSRPPLPEAGAPAATTTTDAGVATDGGSVTPTLPNCSSLPSPVYVVGSTGLIALAAELGALASVVPITLVFEAARSCDGPKAIVLNETASMLGDTTATYWDITGAAQQCLIDVQNADIGLGQLFAQACLNLPQGTQGVGDFLGPVIPIDMVVPTTSTQNAISADALYYTIGLANGSVSPWTDPNEIFFNPGSGPQYDVSQAIGVPTTQWIGAKVTTAQQAIAKVGTSPAPQSTLGMMGSDLVEAAANTSTIKALAYQDVGLGCGYFPNATSTSSDKQNVRDGHYPLWGFSHMFARVNAQNVPINPFAAMLISYFTGAQMTPTGDFLKFVINDRLVPVCAMRVTRQSEMGRLLPFTPTPSCGCYFDSLTKGSSTCQMCSGDSECPSASPHCNLGFCEGS